jgi:uncharacterized protein
MNQAQGILSFISNLTIRPTTSTLHSHNIISTRILSRSHIQSRHQPAYPPARSSLRRMSSSHPPSTSTSPKEFLVHLPDHPNSLPTRLSVRSAHLASTKPALVSGKVLMGGATLSKHPEGGEAPDMTGSVMLVTAESEEEVRRFVAEDVYTKSGVWDLESMRIWPFRTAVRKGVEIGEKVW